MVSIASISTAAAGSGTFNNAANAAAPNVSDVIRLEKTEVGKVIVAVAVKIAEAVRLSLAQAR